MYTQAWDMRRTLCLAKDFLLDVVDIWSEQEHVYDWVIHTGPLWRCRPDARLNPVRKALGSGMAMSIFGMCSDGMEIGLMRCFPGTMLG